MPYFSIYDAVRFANELFIPLFLQACSTALYYFVVLFRISLSGIQFRKMLKLPIPKYKNLHKNTQRDKAVKEKSQTGRHAHIYACNVKSKHAHLHVPFSFRKKSLFSGSSCCSGAVVK